MKFKKLEESIKQAEGNLKHENMKIEEWEKDLVRDFAEGKVNRNELIQNVIEGHKYRVEYSLEEEEVIDPGYEREDYYK